MPSKVIFRSEKERGDAQAACIEKGGGTRCLLAKLERHVRCQCRRDRQRSELSTDDAAHHPPIRPLVPETETEESTGRNFAIRDVSSLPMSRGLAEDARIAQLLNPFGVEIEILRENLVRMFAEIGCTLEFDMALGQASGETEQWNFA